MLSTVLSSLFILSLGHKFYTKCGTMKQIKNISSECTNHPQVKLRALGPVFDVFYIDNDAFLHYNNKIIALLDHYKQYDVISEHEMYYIKNGVLFHKIINSYEYSLRQNVSCVSYDRLNSALYWIESGTLMSFKGNHTFQGSCREMEVTGGHLVMLHSNGTVTMDDRVVFTPAKDINFTLEPFDDNFQSILSVIGSLAASLLLITLALLLRFIIRHKLRELSDGGGASPSLLPSVPSGLGTGGWVHH